MYYNDNKLQMEKILDELSNLKERHQQLLSQISEPHNQEIIMDLQFLIEEKMSAIKLLVTPNPKNKGVQTYPENALHYLNQFPAVFMFSYKQRHLPELPWNFGVMWGVNHRINIVRESFIPPNIKSSALLLALLTATHQATKMGFRVLNIISSDSKIINNIVQSIPKMRSKAYAQNEEEFPSKTLERLDKLMMRNNIILYIKNHTISPTISSVHEQLNLSFQNTLRGKNALQ